MQESFCKSCPTTDFGYIPYNRWQPLVTLCQR